MAAELINISVYRLEPQLGSSTLLVTEANVQHAVSPEQIISAENLPAAHRIAIGRPEVYSKLLVSEKNVTQEYFVSETVAQLVAKSQV